MSSKNILITCMALLFAFITTSASATLGLRAAYQNSALSIDAIGDSGQIQTDVPADAIVKAAFIYAADVWGSGVANIELLGNTLSTASGTTLGPDTNNANTVVWDVTSIMKPVIEGTGGLQDHELNELGRNDGMVLVVVYSNASTAGQTAIILDGELATTGDTTRLDFDTPYAGGDLIMSAAISFSYQVGSTSQSTRINVSSDSVTDALLTSCAGGQDDASSTTSGNGQLITAGGIGDSTDNPDCSTVANPASRTDDELYNLASLLNAGDTFLELDTINPSNDDNVFGLFFSSSFAITDVDDTDITDEPTGPTGPSVPEPASLLLIGLGLLGFNRLGRRAA